MKISLALLISLALFAAFSVLAFSGLFDYLQAAFYQPRVLEERGRVVERLAEAAGRYRQDRAESLSASLADRPYVASAFAAAGQQSREDIFNRQNFFDRLLEENPYLQGVRLLDNDGRRLHFSTYRGDSQTSADNRKLTIQNFNEVEKGLDGTQLVAREDRRGALLLDGAGGRLIFRLPVTDPAGAVRGTALFFFLKQDLESHLLRGGLQEVRSLEAIGQLGMVANLPEVDRQGPAWQSLVDRVSEAWQAGTAAPELASDPLVFEGPEPGRFILLSLPAEGFGRVGLLVPAASLELQPLMKAVLLATVLLTVFLLVFLLFNVRQDPVSVLTQRIKRFQLEVLSEFIEGKEQVDWKRWREELMKGRRELSSRIKRGVGRLPASKEAELDGLIDRSWDEIIGIIEARVGQPARMDIGHLEAVIQKALDQGQFKVARPLAPPPAAAPPAIPAAPREAGAPASPPAPAAARSTAPVSAPAAQVPSPRRREALVVEEIGVEEVSDLETAGPAAEAGGSSAGPRAAAAENVEELEEIPEAETVGEAEEIPEAETVGEAEEAEEIPEVEAVGEAEEAEEIPEVETVGEAEEIPEVEAVEEAEEAEEALEVEPVGGPGKAPEAEVPPALEPLPEAETAAAAESVEELEPLGEIEPLPREPQEVLDELPVEEEPAEVPPAAAPPAAAAPPQGPEAILELLESSAELEVEEVEAYQAPPVQDVGAELEQLAARGTIRTFTMAETQQVILEQRASVVMEDGVYRVREEVRAGGRTPAAAGSGKGLKALAEAALAASPEGEVESGITELLGAGFGLDLSAELEAGQKRGPVPSFSDRHRVHTIQFFEDGLDYDEYLSQYRDGESETRRLKSLVLISRKIKAVNAILLAKEGEGYTSRLRVGLLEKPERIRFNPGEPFYERFLRERRIVLINDRPQQVAGLAGKFNPEDLKYMQAAVFLPATFQKAPALLFLGLPTNKALELKDLIAKLDIY